MRFFLVIFLLPNCFGTALYAQSKKKVNEQLFTQLAIQQNTSDSLLAAQEKLQNELKIATKAVFNANQDLNIAKEQVLSWSSVLRKNYELLALEGDEVSSIISFEEITRLDAPKIDQGLSLGTKELFRTFPWARLDAILGLTGLKIREQNEALTSLIRTNDSINKINGNVLTREQDYLDTLVLLKNQAEKEIKKYNDQTAYIIAKSDAIALKWSELDKLREKKEEEEYLEKLSAEAKKHKRGELYFIPVKPYWPKGEKPVLSTDVKETVYENVILDDFTTPVPPLVIMDVVEEPAEFPGGRDALLKYLKDNVVLPESVLKGEVSGKCYVRFVVSSEGKISNVLIVKGVTDCPECDKEAKRVVQKMPAWQPGNNAGKTVSQWCSIPIAFTVPN